MAIAVIRPAEGDISGTSRNAHAIATTLNIAGERPARNNDAVNSTCSSRAAATDKDEEGRITSVS